jgi:hypothetical protein
MTDPDPSTPPPPAERRRAGIRGSRDRLDRMYPLTPAPTPASPAPGRGVVRVLFTGHADDLAKLLLTLPGLQITGVTAAAELVDGEFATTVAATIQAGLHHYLSSACLHEALTGDPTVAADLHAYCASEKGNCGHKIPGTCKWCESACGCPGH